MCTTCGCGIGQTLIGGQAHLRQRKPDKALRFRTQADKKNIKYNQIVTINEFSPVTADISSSRMVKIERDILSKNNGYAADNRHYFSEPGQARQK